MEGWGAKIKKGRGRGWLAFDDIAVLICNVFAAGEGLDGGLDIDNQIERDLKKTRNFEMFHFHCFVTSM